jgi:hypothetical protein
MSYIKNKRGWVAIVEVSIAIIVLFTFLVLTFNQESKKDTNRFNDLNKAILFQVEENETFRNLVLENDTVKIEDNLRPFLKQFDAKINLTTCIANLGEECSLLVNLVSGRETVSYDFFVSGYQDYESKKLRVFVWEE